jgi:integrase-like protein
MKKLNGLAQSDIPHGARPCRKAMSSSMIAGMRSSSPLASRRSRTRFFAFEVQCVEQRFGDLRALHRIQWLTDNGSIFAANRTLEIAAALNLEPCFMPVESPESNGMVEAFVKTFKRDYIRINPLPDARTALSRIDHWMEDYNSEHPHSRLGYRSPASVHCITSTSRVSGLTGSTPGSTDPV